MTRTLIYDIKRTFLSKSILISMALLIAISLLLINSFGATSLPPSNNANTQVLTWYDNSGPNATYHFIAFATNQLGGPVSGVNFQINLTRFNPQPPAVQNGLTTTPSTYPIYESPTITTNSSGLAEFIISAPLNPNYTFYLRTSELNGYSNTEGGYGEPYTNTVYSSPTTGGPNVFQNATTVPIPPGQIVGLIGSTISSVTSPTNSSQNDIQVLWAGSDGLVPKNYALYYKFLNATETCSSSPNGETCSSTGPTIASNELNETNMQFLTNLTSYQSVLAPPPLEANLSGAAELALALFYPNGTVTSQGVGEYPVFEFYPQPQIYTEVTINSQVTSFFLDIFGFFIPLIAILGSYNSYGKDRVSGVLESVLVQPVSRSGLSLSRFFSSFIAMSIAISISMVVIDGIVWYFTKSFVSSTIILSSAGAFFVELAAFIGIMMLLSRVTKSSGVLIGIGIGIFLVIDFFGVILVALVTYLLHASFVSELYFRVSIAFDFVNPAQFVALVDTYILHTLSLAGPLGSANGLPVTPSQYGLTIPSIIITGILWSIVPLAAFLYLSVKRD